MQGAGGVGGLISMTVYSGSLAGTYFYAFDGNGNVVALVNAADGSVAAQYEYGPFGEVLRATGPMAKANPFRFSTKYQDDETDLLYYGYRYYNAGTGKWLSRDPAEEEDQANLYGFVFNEPISLVDMEGLYTFKELPPEDIDVGSFVGTVRSVTLPNLSIEKQLEITPGCPCKVKQPETFILTVKIVLGRTGSSLGGAMNLYAPTIAPMVPTVL
jgi:RHS repeat-associated protein